VRVLLALLITCSLALAPLKGASAQRERVVVKDYTTHFGAAVADTVNDFNIVMPAHGPLLVYQKMGGPCDGQPSDTAISVCEAYIPGAPFAWAWWWPGIHRWATIEINMAQPHALTPRDNEQIVCHEMMHAIAHIGDNYGAHAQSCVWGSLTDPGCFDVVKLAERFGDPAQTCAGKATKAKPKHDKPDKKHKKHKKHGKKPDKKPNRPNRPNKPHTF
jgi:hypothetical protein